MKRLIRSVEVCCAALVASLVLGMATLSAAPADSKDSAKDGKDAKIDAMFQEGVMMMRAGKHDEAEKLFRKVVKARPDYAEAHSNLGYTQRKQADYEDALKSYETALKLDPDLAAASEYKGQAHVELALEAKKKKDMFKFKSHKGQAEAALAKLEELQAPEAEQLKEALTQLE